MRTIPALIAAALLLVVTAPAAAADGGSARGWAAWLGERGNDPAPRLSWFRVRDNGPDAADRGTYRFRKAGAGGFVMDVRCAKVVAGEGWAEFAGVITRASGRYTTDNVYLVALKDGGSGDDEIGMRSYADDLASACTAANDDKQIVRAGAIYGGSIRVSD